MNLCIPHSVGNLSTILQKRSNPTISFKMTFTDLKILSMKIPPTFNHWYFKGQFFKSFSFMQKLTSHRRNSSQPKGFSKLRAKQFLLFRFNWKPNPPYCQTFPKLAFCFQTDAVQFNHSKNQKKKHLPRGKCFYSNNVAQLGLEPRTCWLWVTFFMFYYIFSLIYNTLFLSDYQYFTPF